MSERPANTTVIRIRLPRDRSFLYFRLDRTGWLVRIHAEWMPRRYYSAKRVEVMRFRNRKNGATA